MRRERPHKELFGLIRTPRTEHYDRRPTHRVSHSVTQYYTPHSVLAWTKGNLKNLQVTDSFWHLATGGRLYPHLSASLL
ncbi:hypothetical protein F2P79_005634 [Pimephales promelas]|nr:hypothetical protein F2P79_005634 [Pimephales promelas]KAG1961692.1 hypothetical protein F2P79_005634 [Pimephales promelas]KAG1961693.1 hypothetical protein F2P79_005634 [Pimephales promelas]